MLSLRSGCGRRSAGTEQREHAADELSDRVSGHERPAVFGGLLALGGVAVGAVMTLRQVRANREGHSIDLFTKAIDQLASDQVSVRHGGVYALEQLSDLDPRYRGHAHALLTAFVRRQRHGRRPSLQNPGRQQQERPYTVAWPTTSEPHWPYSAGGG
jgi:hypothetical protein